jgi:hypothetical protein
MSIIHRMNKESIQKTFSADDQVLHMKNDFDEIL